MNKVIVLLFLLFSIGCTTEKQQPKSTTSTIKTTESEIFNILTKPDEPIIREPYDIGFQIDKLDNNQYILVVSIQLDKGSYLVSPFSNDSYSGRFDISIKDVGNLIMNDTLLEIPRSAEEIDPWGKGLVNLVKENTIYKQKFTILAKDDFEVSGFIRFVIEPLCTMEEVKFIISNNSGKLKVEKINDKC